MYNISSQGREKKNAIRETYPIAARLELLRERIAIRPRRDAAVLLAPAVGRRPVLAGAGVEEPDAAAGHGDVKVVLAEVAARVAGLDDHLLPRDGAAREGELVAGAAPRLLVGAGELDRRPAVRHRVVDRPRALVRAHVRRAAAIAPALGVRRAQRVVRLVARLDVLAAVGLHAPAA